MSKVIENLKNQQQTLVNQRSQMKDQLEAVEKQLGQISFALQAQDAITKEEEALAAEVAKALEAEEAATPSEN